MKAAHHKGSYHRRSRIITSAANANPDTRCWKCNRTLAEVQASKPNARWCSGHLNAGQIDGPMLPECSECSGREGAAMTNAKPSTDLTWP